MVFHRVQEAIDVVFLDKTPQESAFGVDRDPGVPRQRDQRKRQDAKDQAAVQEQAKLPRNQQKKKNYAERQHQADRPFGQNCQARTETGRHEPAAPSLGKAGPEEQEREYREAV